MKSYKSIHTAAISFPLGGIGTGSIGLAGNGALVDWEINNRPNRESINPFTCIAVKAEDSEQVVDWRFLQGDISRDFMGGLHCGNHSWGYGQGPNRGTLAGGRHFENTEFSASFPFADIDFQDSRFPGKITLSAFNPFIPSNDADSSIPAAFFDFSILNTSDVPLKYTVAMSLTNPLEHYGLHAFEQADKISMLQLFSAGKKENECGFGNVTLATDSSSHHQLYWYRGGWFDNLTMFMNDFGSFGPMKQRLYTSAAENMPDTCTLTAEAEINPAEKKTVHFVLAWYVPNYLKYWDEKYADVPAWRNYYAKLFSGSRDCALYCLKNRDRLYKQSKLFSDALFSSSLPDCVKDAIQGNLCTLKTTTCLRLTDGDFYGWEGVNRNHGSCEGTCQHVWNYAYALPFLFPKLEKGLRSNELRYSLDSCGRMHFRMSLPLGSDRWPFRACVDGQMGTVIKCYREWKLSGDTDWLRENWEKIKSCISFAWSKENEDKWDENHTGVLYGRQHHTLDTELFGLNSWLTGFYHAALLSGAEMAQAVGDSNAREEYLSLYKKGHAILEEETFNGRYYTQKIDIHSRSFLNQFGGDASINMDGGYWDEENGEIKYQIGSGCEIDQVIADWHTSLTGLPPVFDPACREKALNSIYRLNFKNMRDLNNPCRIFACNGEKGVTMCAWDSPRQKPKIPIPYAEEVMTGFEYAFADSLLQCGMEQQALKVVSFIRERYDGFKRNPFSEIECGASYARAMASYSLLLTYSGFKFDMTRNMLGFLPLHFGQYFWSADGAWGIIQYDECTFTLNLLYGEISLCSLLQPLSDVKTVKVNNIPVDFQLKGQEIFLTADLKENGSIEVLYR